MLVLTRKPAQAVIVGDTNGAEHLLKVTVLDISGGRVRLGFEANQDFPIHRWEVWERLRAGGRSEPAGAPRQPLPRARLEMERRKKAPPD